MPERYTVLLVDESSESRRSLIKTLEAHGYATAEATSASRAIEKLQRGRFQAAIVDLDRSGTGGTSVLQAVLREQPRLPVIGVTGSGSLELAISAMKAGARDVLPRPIPVARLATALLECVRAATTEGRVPAPIGRLSREMEKVNIIGHSRAMLELFDTIKLVAPRAARVLVTGESGVGKELVARALRDLGSRPTGPFIAINCATLSEQILESELFGHERGAFTSANELKTGVLEAAHGGTLFLDEIDEMGAGCQAKMLRVLERKEFRRVGGTKKVRVDFNLIAATNIDLARSVAEGRFRNDLYYRLKVVTLDVPALRNRKEAIPVLAARFLTEIAAQVGVEPKTFTAGALAALERYAWPGNVRELRNCAEALTLTVRRSVIDIADLPAEIRGAAAAAVRISVGTKLADLEREAIRQALLAYPTIREAAHALGIGERTVYAKMRQYGLAGRSRRSRRH